MSTPELDRSALDGKDREQLSTIAGSMGVNVPTRMRKAEMIDAILGAASSSATSSSATSSSPPSSSGSSSDSSGSGTSGSSRTVRSVRASEADPIAALAKEEDAIAAAVGDGEEFIARPVRRDNSTTKSSDSDSGTTSTSSSAGSDDERASYGEGNQVRSNNRRRRRRGGRSGSDERGGSNEGNRDQNRDQNREGNRGNSEPVGDPVEVKGFLDLRDENYGFLRTQGYLSSKNDVYVSASQVRRFNLRKGDYVEGQSRPQSSSEKYPALLRVDSINEMSPDDAANRPKFEDLTPLFPDSQLRLELAENPLDVTGRIVDLLSPIGKGQRGLIVSPPKAGKTTVLKQIVYSVERNNPEVHLMVLLVDERPEEVTDMRRHVLKGEVLASTFDRPAEEHIQVAELTIDRAKRLVEMGKDVVIVLDGITRLARAYNLAAPTSGRVLSGGVDSTALYPPKRFFGAARNIEEGGSLTIIATALVETGSRMDEVIFEEFKGTGNMELRLDRRMAERRVYPAIDVEASSTRHEELLFDRGELSHVWKLRRVLSALDAESGGSGRGLDLLIEKLRTTSSNAEFLAEIAKAPSLGA